MRNIMMLNDNDDKADVRDEIAETKGIKRKVNEDYRTKLRLVPREQNTKIYKMLKQLRGFMQREKSLKEEIED